MRSLCYECQFSFTLKVELITITKISQWDSLWKRDQGELLGLLAMRCGRKTIVTQRSIPWVIDSIDLSRCLLFAWYAPWHVAHFNSSSSKRIESRIRCRYVWTSCQGFTSGTFLAFSVEPRIWKVQQAKAQHISSWQQLTSFLSWISKFKQNSLRLSKE